jgi:hypothetical protein
MISVFYENILHIFEMELKYLPKHRKHKTNDLYLILASMTRRCPGGKSELSAMHFIIDDSK